MSKSWKHKELEYRAVYWLKSRGCTDIRKEVVFRDAYVRIDVVGYKDGEPAIGIECGEVNNSSKAYLKLPFPIFSYPYEAINFNMTADFSNLKVTDCKPWVQLNGRRFYEAGEKKLMPIDIWRTRFLEQRKQRRKDKNHVMQ
jgi:hypothetical protein